MRLELFPFMVGAYAIRHKLKKLVKRRPYTERLAPEAFGELCRLLTRGDMVESVLDGDLDDADA